MIHIFLTRHPWDNPEGLSYVFPVAVLFCFHRFVPGRPVCVSLLLVTAYLFLFRQFLLFPCQVFSHFNSCPVEVVQCVDCLLPLGDTVAHPCVRVDNDFHWTLHRLFRWYSVTSGIAVRVRLYS